VQGRFYGLGTEIARIEQSIQHVQERNRQLQEDLARNEQESQQAAEHLASDKQKVELWEVELAEIEPELEMLQASEGDSGEALINAEEGMQAWQLEWDEFNQRAAEPRQKAEVEQSRIQHLEQVQTRLLERIRRLEDESSQLPEDDSGDEIALLTEQVAEYELNAEQTLLQYDDARSQIDSLRETIQEHELTLDDARNQLQTTRGRHASLEALQQASKGGDKQLTQWIDSNALNNNARLLENITVAPQWQVAVETVLGDAIQAICVDGLDAVAKVIDNLEAVL